MKAEDLRQPGAETTLLRVIRTIASSAYYDDRTEEEFQRSLWEILFLTRHVGNEPVKEYEWDHPRADQ